MKQTNYPETKNKHLTLDQRNEIEESLRMGMTFKEIGKHIQKDPTTISKEIRLHITVKPAPYGSDKKCPKLSHAPFVCNGCSTRYHCSYEMQYYRAKTAQEEYERTLRESREGIALNKESFYRADEIITDGVKKGQHIYHILHSHEVGMSKSSVYRNIEKGYLSVCNLDLPRKVKFKARKKDKTPSIPSKLKIGRSYEDFLAYTEDHNISAWVEMDTVIGSVGGKALLTFDFTFCNFMFALLLENKSSFEVSQKILHLKGLLNTVSLSFGDFFPLILTDNGSEFSNVFDIENNRDGVKESSLFFTHPYRSCEKPHVEKNHTLFRDIAPPGTSFDSFSQENVNLIFSHVNSVKREALHGKSSFEVFSFLYGEDFAALLGIKPIPSDQVIQSPALLKLL